MKDKIKLLDGNYYNKKELADAREGWKQKPIFAAFNPAWSKVQDKLKKGD